MDHLKRILFGHFNKQLTRQNSKGVGFVIMPAHVHAVVWFPETGQLSNFIQGWKRTFSYAIVSDTTLCSPAKTRVVFLDSMISVAPDFGCSYAVESNLSRILSISSQLSSR
jgi:hypothetical protein